GGSFQKIARGNVRDGEGGGRRVGKERVAGKGGRRDDRGEVGIQLSPDVEDRGDGRGAGDGKRGRSGSLEAGAARDGEEAEDVGCAVGVQRGADVQHIGDGGGARDRKGGGGSCRGRETLQGSETRVVYREQRGGGEDAGKVGGRRDGKERGVGGGG